MCALFHVMGQVSRKRTWFFMEMCLPHKAPLGGREKGSKLAYDGPILIIKGSVQWTATKPTAAESLLLSKQKLFLLSHSRQYGAGVCCQAGGADICLLLPVGHTQVINAFPFLCLAAGGGAQCYANPKTPLWCSSHCKRRQRPLLY